MSTRKLKLFSGKVITLACRRGRSLKHQTEHINMIVLCLVVTFRVDYEMYSCRYGNYPYEKYLRLEEDEHCDLQDKRYELSVTFKM